MASCGVNSHYELTLHNYLHVFHWLRDLYPSLGYKALFDLYCLINKLPINSLSADLKAKLQAEYKNSLPKYAPLSQDYINKFMGLASELAITNTNEIPVGAVIVKDRRVIGEGYNQTLSKNNISLHAEIVAINMAAMSLNSHRLDNCDLYVTIEPCLMCVGAIIHSRIKRVVFGAIEPKTGAIISQYQALNNTQVNRHTEAIGPINNQLYSQQLQRFLQLKR